MKIVSDEDDMVENRNAFEDIIHDDLEHNMNEEDNMSGDIGFSSQGDINEDIGDDLEEDMNENIAEYDDGTNQIYYQQNYFQDGQEDPLDLIIIYSDDDMNEDNGFNSEVDMNENTEDYLEEDQQNYFQEDRDDSLDFIMYEIERRHIEFQRKQSRLIRNCIWLEEYNQKQAEKQFEKLVIMMGLRELLQSTGSLNDEYYPVIKVFIVTAMLKTIEVTASVRLRINNLNKVATEVIESDFLVNYDQLQDRIDQVTRQSYAF